MACVWHTQDDEITFQLVVWLNSFRSCQINNIKMKEQNGIGFKRTSWMGVDLKVGASYDPVWSEDEVLVRWGHLVQPFDRIK